MRVIAGQYRRRTLRSLPGLEIRPTSDRLRETLFNVLCAGNPEALADSTWIDLYAGTGAVGIEALSRGARMAFFIESSKDAADVIASNLKSLGIAHGFQIVRADAVKALRQLDSTAFATEEANTGKTCRLCVSRSALLDCGPEYAKTLAAVAESNLLREWQPCNRRARETI